MNHKSLWTILAVVAVSVLLVMGATAQGIDDPEAVTVQAQVGHAFSYQGRLENNDTTVTDSCDFQFGLFNAASSGTQIGATQTSSNVSVADGYFNATLDFGSGAFTGEARWLEIQVRCPSGSGTYTKLTPRQELTPAPYALGVVPGAQVQGNVETYSVFGVSNEGSGNGIYGKTEADTDYVSAGVLGYSVYTCTFGVLGESDMGTGVQGRVVNAANTNPAVTGWNEGGGEGVYGRSVSDFGVEGETLAAGFYEHAGVRGHSIYSQTFGVLGESDMGTGVEGRIINTANTNPAVTGYNAGGGKGVAGYSDNSHGVYGETRSSDGYGVSGYSGVGGDGVHGWNSGGEGAGVWGGTDVAGSFGVDGWNGATSGWAAGVFGRSESPDGMGVYGSSGVGGDGVRGWTTGGAGTGVWGGTNDSSSVGINGWNESSGTGIIGESVGGTGIQARSHSWRPFEVYGSSWDDVEFYVSNTGDVYADGTFHTPAADFAEMLPAQTGLEPGDVLIIGADGKLTLSTTANQTAVAGVYSTQPGFVGGVQEVALDDEIPLAIVGVVPVKVSAENGPIQPGDLLTTSDTPGYAMKAQPLEIDGVSFYPSGVILGKALEALEEGTGVIQVLVTLQ